MFANWFRWISLIVIYICRRRGRCCRCRCLYIFFSSAAERGATLLKCAPHIQLGFLLFCFSCCSHCFSCFDLNLVATKIYVFRCSRNQHSINEIAERVQFTTTKTMMWEQEKIPSLTSQSQVYTITTYEIYSLEKIQFTLLFN